MAPARRRALHEQQNLTVQQSEQVTAHVPQDVVGNQDVEAELFIDPMLGIPLAIYIDKDVNDRDVLVELVTKYGGIVSPGYSSVPYVLVDPLKPSGQNLYRQYVSKKGKIILDARWIHQCVNAGQLQTFHTNWGGCKVTGEEMNISQASASQLVIPTAGPSNPDHTNGDSVSSQTRRRSRQPAQMIQQQQQQPQPQPITHVQPSQTVQHPAQPQAPQELEIPPPVAAVVQPAFGYPIFIAQPRPIHPGQDATAQAWQSQQTMTMPQTHIAPQQTQHMLQRAAHQAWEGYDAHTGAAITADPNPYDYRYRDEQWTQPHRTDYYESLFEDEGPYEPPPPQPYIEQPPTQSDDVSPSQAVETSDRSRGRKRTRSQFNAPAAPASTLVTNRNPPARSPTPPTRIIKSTYGGNLFTADDVMYLKKYIDYCQDQGLVLSLREICERIAIKAPHHTFYSWRRYCNKHQIRLGGYVMNQPRVIASSDQQVAGEEQSIDDTAMSIDLEPAPVDLLVQSQEPPPPPLEEPPPIDTTEPRNRSPTPPRALFRSTTGKGVAFTDEDINFLVRFMDYRKSQGPLDMVLFWKEVAAKAPHHSRASWMKYWRRHKHELNRTDTDAPLPAPPDKKMRYSREDDILLAKYFAEKPEGTSDKVFQAFGRLHPHHPWKGWQEHHRIHKAKIDHLVKQIHEGVFIDVEMAAALA
ncbi:hypothetical protein EYR40_006384 [Pleurotus pulmonarius]|nr:hypothetical protein EYR36_011005 [Pleurotus pulmonarius]KAF4599292.1 hypothetical protein EYR40_006384 [Pleurotus pulmonarius]